MDKIKREPQNQPKREGPKIITVRLPSRSLQSIVKDSVRNGVSEEIFRTRVERAAQVEILAESVGKLQNPPSGDAKEHASHITIQGQKFEVTAAQVDKPLHVKEGTIKLTAGDMIWVEVPDAANEQWIAVKHDATPAIKPTILIDCDASSVNEKNKIVKRATKQFRILNQEKRHRMLSALRDEYTPEEKNRTLAFNDSLPIFEAP